MKRALLMLAFAAVLSMGATTTVRCSGIPNIIIDGWWPIVVVQEIDD